MQRTLILAALAAFATSGAATANANPAPNPNLEEVTIVGSREDARVLPGTGSVIDSEQIRIEAASDINKLLKTVPGVYVLEEDGHGLRPNIGIRGATSERSSKITLLEDGVMIAPAPYSNPAAYYFPTTLRMHKVEVLKGAPLLRYGPQTTGGVVNLVSTPIPQASGGNLNLLYGENAEGELLANYGARSGGFGFLVETAQLQNDGFKDIDRSSGDSGYEISDYMLKLSWESERQSLLFKAQYSEETSDETYLGLTDADFDDDSTRRYGLSEPDRMDNEHEGYNLVYRLALGDNVQMSTTGYYNKFSRNWFKLSGGGSLVSDANAGDAFAQGVLDGTQDIEDLQYKNNNRDYESRGVELNFDVSLGDHELSIGGRVHEDEMDRFQPSDYYDQINGALVFSGIKEPVGSDNREETAEAMSFWVVDSWQATDALNVNLALRYEDVETQRKQYGDRERTDLASTRSNSSDELLPGASFTYDFSDHWQVLGGVHQGFSPLGGGAQENEEPEMSTNWEAGLRYRGAVFIEAVGFYSDFENKTENCSNASPCSNGDTSGAFNTGEAEIYGLEFQLGGNFDMGDFQLPVDLMYTYTVAEVSKDNADEGFAEGDRLAAIPENTLSLRAGIESNSGWGSYAVARYTDSMCVDIGCNDSGSDFDSTEDLFVVDLIGRYAFNANATVFVKLENMFDEQAIVSRQPDGARPNKPRTALVGLQYAF